MSHQIGGGGQAGCETSWSSAQTKKPAEYALVSKESQYSHCYWTHHPFLLFMRCDAWSCLRGGALITKVLFFSLMYSFEIRVEVGPITTTNWANLAVWSATRKQIIHMTNHFRSIYSFWITETLASTCLLKQERREQKSRAKGMMWFYRRGASGRCNLSFVLA